MQTNISSAYKKKKKKNKSHTSTFLEGEHQKREVWGNVFVRFHVPCLYNFLCQCLFVGQVMFDHHSDQMPQGSQVSRNDLPDIVQGARLIKLLQHYYFAWFWTLHDSLYKMTVAHYSAKENVAHVWITLAAMHNLMYCTVPMVYPWLSSIDLQRNWVQRWGEKI